MTRNYDNRKIKIAKQNYFSEYFTLHHNNTKKTWDGIKRLVSFKAQNKTCPSSILHNNNLIDSPSKIAETFNDYFVSIGIDIAKKITKAKKTHYDYLGNYFQECFYLNPTNEKEISLIIDKLDNNKSTGPNSIPVDILKYNKDIFSMIFSRIANLSFNHGIFPEALKIAKVVPIFKSGNSMECSNYRPISLLSVVSKILEKLVHKRIYSFFNKNNLIYNRQFGFRPKYSTSFALLDLIEDIKKKIDNGNFVCGVFLDLKKAFDTVDHKILLDKLNHYGIRGVTNEWFRSYLFQRKQFVQVNNFKSSIKEIQCGVPQGSTLGPLLFLIYINDMNTLFNQCVVRHFADDTNILFYNKKLKTIETVLNHELKKIVDWLRANKLSLNEIKTEFIIFRSPQKLLTTNISIKLNKFKLTPVHYVKYLGMYIDNTLSWKTHINNLSNKLARANGIISKLRHYVSFQSIKSVYYAIFYSHVIYGALVWQFTSAEYISKISNIQKKSVRLMSFSDFRAPTNDLFHNLKILKLNDIFQSLIIKLIFQYHKNDLPNVITSLFIKRQLCHNYETRNINLLDFPSVKTTKYGLKSLRFYGVSLWNRLCNNFSVFEKILSYKKINKYLVRHYLAQYE